MVHSPAMMSALVILALSPALDASADEWSRFRGPNGGGVSDATTVPVRWSDSDYNWKVRLPGAGHSSPVIWGHRVFVTCGDATAAKQTILCLEASDGRVLWRRDDSSQAGRQHRDNSLATATPAVDADGVVVTWTTPEEVVLMALDLKGRELWRRSLGPFVTVQGSGISPILVEDLVVLENDQEDPSLIPGFKKNPPEPPGKSFWIAVDRKTGRTRWQVQRPTSFSAYATPCVYHNEFGRAELIFTGAAQGISGVDAATGKIRWELGQKFLDRSISSPVVAPGLVLAGCGAGLVGTRFVAVRPGSPEKGREPTIAYEVKKSIPLVPTPVVKDDRLFLWTDDGVVSCLRASNGEVIWRQRVGGSFYGSPVWVDRRLYCIARNGDVVVVSAGDTFEVLARVPLGEASYATPAIAGGAMYLRTRSQLFSLGGKARREDARR
jgi:outer membrane protein assembly factor BamB